MKTEKNPVFRKNTSHHASFTLIELLVITSHLCCNRMRDVLKKNKAERASFSPARGQVKLYSFTCPWAGEAVQLHLN